MQVDARVRVYIVGNNLRNGRVLIEQIFVSYGNAE